MNYFGNKIFCTMFLVLIVLLSIRYSAFAQDLSEIWLIKVETNRTTITNLDEKLPLLITESTKILDCDGLAVPWPIPLELNETPVQAFIEDDSFNKENKNVTKIKIQCQ